MIYKMNIVNKILSFPTIYIYFDEWYFNNMYLNNLSDYNVRIITALEPKSALDYRISNAYTWRRDAFITYEIT